MDSVVFLFLKQNKLALLCLKLQVGNM